MITRTKTHVGILIFVLLSSTYLLVAKGKIEITDTYFSVATAKAIATDHSLSPDSCLPGHCLKSPKDGKYYTKSGLGLAFLFTPFIALSKIIAALTHLPENQTADFLISFYNIFFGAGSCVIMFYLIKFFRNSDRVSLIMALLLGLGTFCFRYSIGDFSEPAQMFFLLLTIYCLFKNSFRSLILAAIAFCCLFFVKAIYFLCLPILIFYIFSKDKRSLKENLKFIGIFFFISLTGFILILILNYTRFGEIFEFGYGRETNMFYLSGILRNAKKLTFWLDKGIFIYNPLFILGILGYIKLFKSFRKESILLFSIIALNFLFTCMWFGWHGGWAWGPRYLVPTAALWLIPCFLYFYKKGIIRIAFISLIFVSLSIQFLSITQGDLQYLAICNANDGEGLKKGMPAQIIGSALVLKHKLIEKNDIYNLSEFGINSDTKVSASLFKGYRRFDFWYLRLGRYFHQPIFNYMPILLLFLLIACFLRLLKITKIS